MPIILPSQPQNTPLHQTVERHPGYRWLAILGVAVLTPLGVVLGFIGLGHSSKPEFVNVPNIVDFSINETEVQQDDAMRKVHGVDAIYYPPDQKDGVPLNDVLQYSFGYCYGFLIQTSYDPHRVLNDDLDGDHYEVHQLEKGQWFVIGFVGLDTYQSLTYNAQAGVKFTLYRHRWLGAPRIISIPLKHLVTTNRRTINSDSGEKLITVLDCEWN